MDEIIKQIAAATGIDPAVAQRAAGIVLSYLSREGPADAVGALLDALPGSRDLATGNGGGSLLGIVGDLTGAGLGMGEIQGFASALLDQVRAKAGPEKVDAVMAGIPGLAGLI
jgi:hypothetical protein